MVPHQLCLADYIDFDQNLHSDVMYRLNEYAGKNKFQYTLYTWQFWIPEVVCKYPNLNLNRCHKEILSNPEMFNWLQFRSYTKHPPVEFENFVCCFNRQPHVGRQLLTSLMYKFGFVQQDYFSKNFINTNNESIIGCLQHLGLSVEEIRLFEKFFLVDEEFLQKKYLFDQVCESHRRNVVLLQNKLTKSFLHLVSETKATNYHPFVSEKFLYSVVTRGLFLAYAQPNWHSYLEKYYGFRQFKKIFDYEFDQIKNPVKRLMSLMSMIFKFSKLSKHDWNDLYQLEIETIEYNYDHYFSKRYLKIFDNFM